MILFLLLILAAIYVGTILAQEWRLQREPHLEDLPLYLEQGVKR